MMRPDNRQGSTRLHPAAHLLAQMIRDAGSASTPAMVFGLGCGLDSRFDGSNPNDGLGIAWTGFIPVAARAHGMSAAPATAGDTGVLLAELHDGHAERAVRLEEDRVELADGRSVGATPALRVWTIEGTSRPATAEDIEGSLRATAQRMDSPTTDADGLNGLAALVDYISGLDATPEARNVAHRLAADILLHSGGGAAWRRFYRDFLNEASVLVPRIKSEQLGISMTRVGDTWQTLGEELGRQASADEPSWAQAAKYALAVQTFEETFWERVKVVFS